jgi:hypothetical protein
MLSVVGCSLRVCLLSAAHFMMSGVHCTVSAARCLLLARCLPHVVCLHVVCCTLFAARRLPHVACRTSPAASVGPLRAWSMYPACRRMLTSACALSLYRREPWHGPVARCTTLYYIPTCRAAASPGPAWPWPGMALALARRCCAVETLCGGSYRCSVQHQGRAPSR